MTIKLLTDIYGLFVGDYLQNISYEIETDLVAAGFAVGVGSDTPDEIYSIDFTGFNAHEIETFLLEPITRVPMYSRSADRSPMVFARQKALDRFQRGTPLTYIVSGDSTRKNTFNGMDEYYGELLAKAGINLVYNATSGQRGELWADNVGLATLAQAIAATDGTGTNTILEFSFGINDLKEGRDQAYVKVELRAALDLYLAACPDASVVLVEPVPTSNSTRNAELTAIYGELADELGLPLVLTAGPMGAVYDGTVDPATDRIFYSDGTHPSQFGSMRLIHIILSAVLPAELFSVVTISNIVNVSPPEALVYEGFLDGGFWSSSTGNLSVNANWTRLSPMLVDGAATVRVLHGGNRWDAKFMDSEGVFLEGITMTSVPGEAYREIIIPDDAVEMRLNVSSQVGYDPGADTITAEYVIIETVPPTMAVINMDTLVRLKVV